MFLRQAGAIIAAERGLSKTSRAKLQSLAIRLELSEDQFHLAIDELQNTVKLPQALNHWERSFVTFLERELQSFHGKVLSISLENRAIDLAARKYQISEVRAQQLIQQTADELGIGRMAEGDAERFGERLIVDAVGRQAALSPGQLEELQHLGDRWGLSREAVRRLVDQVLDDNRKPTGAGAGQPWVLLLPAGAGLLALLLLLLWQLGWWPGPSEIGAGPQGPSPTAALQPNLEKPSWWNEDLDRAWVAVEDPRLDRSKRAIQSADPENRLEGMEELIESARESPVVHPFPGCEHLELNRLIGLLYLHDPDPEVSESVIESMNDAFRVGAGEGPMQIDAVYWAVQLLAVLMELDETGDPSLWAGRMDRVQELSQDVVGPYPDNLEAARFFTLAYQRVSIDLWRQLVQQSQAGARLEGSQVRRLKQQTAPVLDPEVTYQLEMAVVRELLEQDEGQWETVKDSMTSLVQGASSSQLVDWIDQLFAVRDPRLRDFLATTLIARTGVPVEDESLDGRMKSLREHRFGPAVVAWLEKNRQSDKVASGVEPWFDPPPDSRPQAIVEVVYASNVSLAALVELETRQDLGYLSRLLASGLPRLNQVTLTEGGAGDPRGTNPAGPSPAERRLKDRAIERLVNAEADRLAVRISALESLAKVVGKFSDLPYAEVQVLTDYFLADMELQESLAVERLSPQFSHLPAMHLALADRIRQGSGQESRVLLLHQRLQGDELPIAPTPNWRELVANSFVQFALGILTSRDELAISQSDHDWLRLEKLQRSMLMTRARIMDQWLVPQVWGDTDYETALGRLVKQRVIPERRQWFENALRMAVDAPPLARWVLLNQLLIELVGGELEQAGEVLLVQRDQVMQEYRQRVKEDLSLGQRLLLSEQALLQLVSIARQERVDRWLEE